MQQEKKKKRYKIKVSSYGSAELPDNNLRNKTKHINKSMTSTSKRENSNKKKIKIDNNFLIALFNFLTSLIYLIYKIFDELFLRIFSSFIFKIIKK